MNRVLITCCKCGNRYDKSGDQWKVGAKVRCSVCKYIWILESINMNAHFLTSGQKKDSQSIQTLFSKELLKDELLRRLPLKEAQKQETCENTSLIDAKKMCVSSKCISKWLIAALIFTIFFWAFYFSSWRISFEEYIYSLFNK
jgi:hypothetical protein